MTIQALAHCCNPWSRRTAVPLRKKGNYPLIYHTGVGYIFNTYGTTT